MKLIHVICTDIFHSFVISTINCGYDFITNISQDQACISTGTSVVMQLVLELDLISLQLQ